MRGSMRTRSLRDSAPSRSSSPRSSHTIGFVVPIGIDRKPVVAELIALFEPYELDRHLPA